jgi:cytochrome P450
MPSMSNQTDIEDPFRRARAEAGVLEIDVDGEKIPLVLRYEDVQACTRDWQTFSSDAPFRVPVPSEEALRPARQLPIETDPPLHTAYRALVQPFFNRARTPEYISAIRQIVASVLNGVLDGQEFEFVQEVALPLQSKALAVLLKLPLDAAEEWISWGTHVFHAGDAPAEEKGAVLDDYIERRITAAQAAPGEDFFGHLVTCDFQGRPLTREEINGFANLVFAGGRDTVINTLSFAVHFLAHRPDQLRRLRDDRMLVRSAVEEFIRVASPLTHIGRVCPAGAEMHGYSIAPDHRISLCWASANRDPSVFAAADDVLIDRRPNPHLGFGFGAHACLGASHARLVLQQFIERLCEKVEQLQIIAEDEHVESWPGYARKIGFTSLRMRSAADK